MKARENHYHKADLFTGVLHFGLGRFHRAHQAWFFHQAAQKGDNRWGVQGVSLRSNAVSTLLAANAFDYHLWIRDHASSLHQIQVLQGCYVLAEDRVQIMRCADSPDLQIVTVTVTEKGYCLNPEGQLDEQHPAIQHDLNAPQQARSFIGVLAQFLQRRFEFGQSLVVLSCDNLECNGTRLKNALLRFLDLSKQSEVIQWLEKECLFPNTMVDRIVPNTQHEQLLALKSEAGIEDPGLVVTEQFCQWVIEDPGHQVRKIMPLEGLEFVDEIGPYAQMKLRLLNAAHSFLAYRGQMMGYDFVHDAIADTRILYYVQKIFSEARFTLKLDPGYDLDSYIETLIRRFENHHVAHNLAQIAMDGSQKLPIRVLHTIRERYQAGRFSPFLHDILQAWMEYLRASRTHAHYQVDDPLKDWIYAELESGRSLDDIIHDPQIFGGMLHSS